MESFAYPLPVGYGVRGKAIGLVCKLGSLTGYGSPHATLPLEYACELPLEYACGLPLEYACGLPLEYACGLFFENINIPIPIPHTL